MAVGRLEAVLTANTAGFDGPMQKSGQVAEATARVTARAAKQAAEATAQAAKFAGDSVEQQSLRQVAAQRTLTAATQDLRRVQSFVKQGFLDGAEGANVEAAALQRVVAARLEAAAASEKQAVAAGHAAVSQQAAASAAVRSLEGNPGIRSIERFLTIIPGVSGALTTIFPLIGAAGLAGLFFDMGEKGVEAFQKVQNASSATRAAFADLHDKSRLRIDDLELENQKIQDQIDKIGGHPNNGVATALLEARKQADALLVSLQQDRKELEELFKQQGTGKLGGILSAIGAGPASTGRQEKELLADQRKLNDAVSAAARDRDEITAKATDPAKIKEANGRYNKAIHDAFQSQIDTYVRESARLRKEEADSRSLAAQAESLGGSRVGAVRVTDNSQKVANVEGRAQQLRDAQKAADLNASIFGRNETLGSARQAKEVSAVGDKAAESRLKAAEVELNQRKLLANLNAKAEFDYWEVEKSAFRVGSAQYNTIVAKQAELAAAGARQAHEAIVKSQRDSLRENSGEGKSAADAGILKNREDQIRGLQERDRTRDIRADSGNELNAVRDRNNTALAEAAVNDQAGRGITRYAAAVQLAEIHARSYGEELSRLYAKAQQVAQASYLKDPEKEAQLGRIGEQAAGLQGRRALEAQQDQARLQPVDSSALVGAKDALDQFTDATKDSAGAARDFAQSTLNRLNSTILNGGGFRSTGAEIFRGAGGALLNKAEGSVLSALGLGSKAPKGTRSDPLNTNVLNLPGITGTSSAIGLGGADIGTKAFGQLLYGGAKAAVSSGSKIFSTLASFLPGFAEGGGIGANTLAIVGEKGPELFMPSSSGTIVPNNKLGMGGDTHVHVDARGATDPAQVKAQVRQGIAEAMPYITRTTLTAQGEVNRRSPSRLR